MSGLKPWCNKSQKDAHDDWYISMYSDSKSTDIEYHQKNLVNKNTIFQNA